MDSLVERKSDLRGYIVGNGDKTKWRAWIDGLPVWVDDPADATRYGFRSDANAVHGEDEDAWCIVEYKDVATPSARITGDKDRENLVEGAPYGEGLIGRIDQLQSELLEQARIIGKSAEREARLAARVRELERALGKAVNKMELARQRMKAFRDVGTVRGACPRYGEQELRWSIDAARQALKEQADADQ